MHFKNARNASVYAVFRAFFTQSLAKLRTIAYKAFKFKINLHLRHIQEYPPVDTLGLCRLRLTY